MNRKKITNNKMVAKTKRTVLSCSTPEHQLDSPSRDSDSICDSEAASPVPFLCTQDGADAQTDVVWNFYTPKSETASTRTKNTTPVSRRPRKAIKSNLIQRPLPKRKAVKQSQKKSEFLQELLELNQNVHEFLIKKPISSSFVEKPHSEEDMFSDTSDSSPRSGIKARNRCLRKNVLSSKFPKTEPESGLESDDSMNECLLKASQVVEENILNIQTKPPKRFCSVNNKTMRPSINVQIDQDSMDAILSNIKIESPSISRLKKCDSPRLNNDSFDSLLGNLNDSALERLSQIPIKNQCPSKIACDIMNNKDSNWTLKELIVCDGSPSSKSIFSRYNSMPESPSVTDSNKPSTSGMVFGRYNSMPFDKSNEKIAVLGDSPIRCTPDEIKKKHQQAREKLLAKRLLPFTTTQQSNAQSMPSQSQQVPKKALFQPKVPRCKMNTLLERKDKSCTEVDLKLLIEKKRQEALMKLRKRQPQNK